jgi:hypothetical protein
MRWTHDSVYDALAAKFGVNSSTGNTLTYLYEQQPDCAVLYAPDAEYRSHPLHMHPGMASWRPEVYRALLPSIELIKLEKKIDKYLDRRFLCWRVLDWDAFATGLGLEARAAIGQASESPD